MLLGRYHMVSEWNYLECQSSECQQGYAMILFVMNPLQLLSLQVVELEGQR